MGCGERQQRFHEAAKWGELIGFFYMGGSVDLLKNMFSIMRITRKPQKYTLVACLLIKRADEIWNTQKEVLCVVSIDNYFSFFSLFFSFCF